MTEQISNFGSTTLSTTINNSITTVVVASATNFPSSGTFRIVIDSEIMLVTNVSGTTFTVTRGQEGTTAVGHTSGVGVIQSITSSGLDNYVKNYAMFDISSSRPVAGVKGRYFRPTDAPVEYWDDGTQWNTVCREIAIPYGPLNIGSWTTHNQGTSTFSQFGDIIQLTCPGSNGDNWRFIYKTLPTAPYTLVASIWMPSIAQLQYTSGCLGLYDTSSGKLKTMSLLADGTNMKLSVDYYTNDTTYNSLIYRGNTFVSAPVLFKIQDDTTNLTWSISYDGGNNYLQVAQTTNTDFVVPNHVFLGMDNTYNGSSFYQSFYVLSYTES